MKCIFLAAGYATRLYPLTENFPKPLLAVKGKTILDWMIDDLSPCVDGFIVVSNHKFAGRFTAWADGRNITVVDDGTDSNETRLGAVKDILFAVNALDLKEDCLVLAGDNLLEFSLRPFLDFAGEKKASCVMCYPENDPAVLRRTAVITREMDGRITSFEEKPQKPRGELAVPAFYYYTAQDLQRIPEALDEGCGYDAPGSFAAWLSGKTTMYAWTMPGRRFDIGNLESYERVQATYQGLIL